MCDAGLQPRDEPAVRVQREAGHALGQRPGLQRVVGHLQPADCARLDVDPPQRAGGRVPQRALADAVAVAARCGSALVVARRNQSRLVSLRELTSALAFGSTSLVGLVYNEY